MCAAPISMGTGTSSWPTALRRRPSGYIRTENTSNRLVCLRELNSQWQHETPEGDRSHPIGKGDVNTSNPYDISMSYKIASDVKKAFEYQLKVLKKITKPMNDINKWVRETPEGKGCFLGKLEGCKEKFEKWKNSKNKNEKGDEKTSDDEDNDSNGDNDDGNDNDDNDNDGDNDNNDNSDSNNDNNNDNENTGEKKEVDKEDDTTLPGPDGMGGGNGYDPNNPACQKLETIGLLSRHRLNDTSGTGPREETVNPRPDSTTPFLESFICGFEDIDKYDTSHCKTPVMCTWPSALDPETCACADTALSEGAAGVGQNLETAMCANMDCESPVIDPETGRCICDEQPPLETEPTGPIPIDSGPIPNGPINPFSFNGATDHPR